MAKKKIFLTARPVLTPEQAASDPGGLLSAASLTMRLLNSAKVSTLAALVDDPTRIPVNIHLEPRQLDLLHTHRSVLSCVRARAGGSEPSTIAVCLSCGRWLMLGGASKSVAKRCQLTVGCPGPMLKASAAVERQPVAG